MTRYSQIARGFVATHGAWHLFYGTRDAVNAQLDQVLVLVTDESIADMKLEVWEGWL